MGAVFPLCFGTNIQIFTSVLSAQGRRPLLQGGKPPPPPPHHGSTPGGEIGTRVEPHHGTSAALFLEGDWKQHIRDTGDVPRGVEWVIGRGKHVAPFPAWIPLLVSTGSASFIVDNVGATIMASCASYDSVSKD